MRERVDHAFEEWAGWVYRRAWWVIAFWTIVLGLLLPRASNNSIDVDVESMLGQGHPILVAYQNFKHQFGRDDSTLLVFRPANPFDLEFLSWLRDLQLAIEDELPYLDEVTSLINARVTRGEADTLIVEDLFEEWPPTPERLAFAESYAKQAPFYQNLLLSRDHSMTIMLVELSDYPREAEDALGGFEDETDSASERTRLNGMIRNGVLRELQEILDRFIRPDVEILMAGQPIVAQRSGDETVKGMARFTGLSVLGIVAILVFLFRRASGAILPLGIALLTIGATFGVSGIRGQPLNITTQMIPTLLLAVNVSSSIHLIFMFFQRLDAGASRETSLRDALGHSALPVVFANLTTAGGMLSFVAADLGPVRDVGIFAPTGIMIGLTLSLSLLPALLAVTPVKAKQIGSALTRPGAVQRALVAVGDLAARRPWATIAGCLVVASLAIAGSHRLYLTFYPVEFLNPSDPLWIWTDRINEEFRSGVSLEMVLDTGRENGLHDPDLLKKLDSLYDRIPELRGGPAREISVGKSLSYVDILKEIHRALNENRPEFYTVPTERALAAQELLLFENSGSDDLEEFVDSQFSVARFSLFVPFEGGEKYTEFEEDAVALFREILPEYVSVTPTGVLKLFVTMVAAMREGTISSYLTALLVITPLMMLLIGSFRGGMASMLPNLLPIAMAIGLIGWFSREFSIYTVLVCGIAIGLAVDDTIHVFHQFHRYFDKLGDARAAIHETMRTTGLAILTTTTVLALGFFVYASSPLRNLQWMGWGLMTAISLAFLADVLLAPALLSLLYRNRGRKEVGAGP